MDVWLETCYEEFCRYIGTWLYNMDVVIVSHQDLVYVIIDFEQNEMMHSTTANNI